MPYIMAIAMQELRNIHTTDGSFTSCKWTNAFLSNHCMTHACKWGDGLLAFSH